MGRGRVVEHGEEKEVVDETAHAVGVAGEEGARLMASRGRHVGVLSFAECSTSSRPSHDCLAEFWIFGRRPVHARQVVPGRGKPRRLRRDVKRSSAKTSWERSRCSTAERSAVGWTPAAVAQARAPSAS